MAADPYKYFRIEARELVEGLTQGVLDLESGAGDKGRVGSLLRLAHTLKGASRVVKQPEIAKIANRIEDLLSPFREGVPPVPKECARDVLQAIDRITNGLAALDSSSAVGSAATAKPVREDSLETVRVEVEEIELLLRRMARLGAELAGIEDGMEGTRRVRQTANTLLQQLQVRAEISNGHAHARARGLAEQLVECVQSVERRLSISFERLEREFTQARELAAGLRLLPASSIFPSLARTARDAAVTLGKQVRLDTSGGDVRLEVHILATLRELLLHLVRNAAAHGIEVEPVRRAAGKAACGQIEIKVERRGRQAAFLCSDDGSGIDLGAIRRIAVAKGIISPGQAERLEFDEAIDLLLKGGMSTTATPTEISGRGIGLDVVRDAVARVKGTISVASEPGKGTRVEICVPVSMSSVLALEVASGRISAFIPLESVREIVRLESNDIVSNAGRHSVAYRGHMIPFLPLTEVLALSPERVVHERWSAAIIGSGAFLAAIGVDRLLRTAAVVIQPLPALTPANPAIAGATLDRNGNAALVLDSAGLIEAAQRGVEPAQASSVRPEPILVIDDSLTTRMVEQSILESAGYEVELAVSGEEALEKARARRFSLFLVDIEMPGLNGFEFVSRTRADPVLSRTPAILVTSRMSVEDRRRGTESGARAYIVKSEFDQAVFLQTVRELVR